MNTQHFKCADCNFETDILEEMDRHLSEHKHNLDITGDQGKTAGGKTITEATGIPDDLLGRGRGQSDPVEGVKDDSDDAEQNTDETVP